MKAQTNKFPKTSPNDFPAERLNESTDERPNDHKIEKPAERLNPEIQPNDCMQNLDRTTGRTTENAAERLETLNDRLFRGKASEQTMRKMEELHMLPAMDGIDGWKNSFIGSFLRKNCKYYGIILQIEKLFGKRPVWADFTRQNNIKSGREIPAAAYLKDSAACCALSNMSKILYARVISNTILGLGCNAARANFPPLEVKSLKNLTTMPSPVESIYSIFEQSKTIFEALSPNEAISFLKSPSFPTVNLPSIETK